MTLLLTQWPQFSEISNFKTHLTLRDLRPAGTKKRGVPLGYGFNLVTCPNYFFESIGWLSISAMTGSYSCALVSPFTRV